MGDVGLDGPEGSWKGTTRALAYPDGSVFGQEIMVGEGAYEGLLFVITSGAQVGEDDAAELYAVAQDGRILRDVATIAS